MKNVFIILLLVSGCASVERSDCSRTIYLRADDSVAGEVTHGTGCTGAPEIVRLK